jgi:hypothetical protein
MRVGLLKKIELDNTYTTDLWPSIGSGGYVAYSEQLRFIKWGSQVQKELNGPLYVGIK